ncbi:MAG: hypothetical protein KDA71_02610, partial [Planctomycetales bacterium]|nr:hypothetical protein [Planctomycetales bacterium]
DRRPQIDKLVQAGRTSAACREQLQDVVVENAWNTDLVAARNALAGHGRSWLRIFRRPYRDAQTLLRAILVAAPPKDVDGRIQLVDQLLEGQRALRALEADSSQALGSEAFGKLWSGVESDFGAMQAICEWETAARADKVAPAFRVVLARLGDTASLQPLIKQISALLQPFLSDLKQLVNQLKLDSQLAFAQTDLTKLPMNEILDRLEQWESSGESLSQWVSYSTRRRALKSLGLAELVREIHTGQTRPDEVVARCELAFYEAIIRLVFCANPELAQFNGASHEKLLERFRELDKKRIELARYEVAQAHYDRVPKADSAIGEVGLVRREIQKKRRHLPIRRLLAEAGRAVQAIKPVFMMSPMSVA